MTNPNFDLLNVLPVTTREHSATELALAAAGINPLRIIETFNCELEVVKHIIENDGLGSAHTAFEDALKNSVIYKKWQSSMPFLRDVPNIHAYRTVSNIKNDVALLDAEIVRYGGYLSKGQILYRGGKFQTNNIEIINGPISTSMMPSVARWHAIKTSGEIAMLEVAESNRICAFAYKISGNQLLTHEYEVLLQNNIHLEYVRTSSHLEMKIHEFKIGASA